MTRDEAEAIIKRGLGYRATQSTTIVSALQEAQRNLELGMSLPEFLLSYDNSITVTANVATFTLPTGFIRLHNDYELYFTNAYGKKVFLPRRMDLEAYEAYVGTGDEDDNEVIDQTNGGYPNVWVKRGKTTGVFVPTPTVSFTAYLTCYVGAALLESGTTENAWLANAPNYLIGEAGIIAAMQVRDKDAVQRFTMMRDRGGRGYLADVINDELAGRGLVMGRNN